MPFAQIIGQEGICEAFRRFIAAGRMPHSVFYGPSGCGKTTFARALAAAAGAKLVELDAANFSLSALREAIANSGGVFATVVFIDEIHRLNRAQLDSLLKPLENPGWTLIAATTEQPKYALGRALLSRVMCFAFAPLGAEQMREILALRLLPGELLSPEAEEFLVTSSGADARAMINLLECARTLGDFSLAALKRLRPFMLTATAEHDAVVISALIKSMRASDANAAVYYLARALSGGMQPEYIARRLVIFAAEDVGNAQPNALLLASSALAAAERIGMPEIRIVLAQVVALCAESKKSNASYRAINAAMNYCAQTPVLPAIPEYFDNRSPAHSGYIYPHDSPDFDGSQQPCAPGVPRFYAPRGVGYEANFALWAQQGRYK